MSMPPRSRTGSGPLIAGLLIVLAIVIAVIALAAAGVTPQQLWDGFFPIENQTPVTDRSLSTKSLYDFVFYIAAAIFILVEGLIIYSAFRYRRKPSDVDLPPQTHGNNLVEIVWTLIPTVIVAVLFVLSWQTLNVVDAKVTTDVHVRAIAAALPVVVRVPRRAGDAMRRSCSSRSSRPATRAACSSRSASRSRSTSARAT